MQPGLTAVRVLFNERLVSVPSYESIHWSEVVNRLHSLIMFL